MVSGPPAQKGNRSSAAARWATAVVADLAAQCNLAHTAPTASTTNEKKAVATPRSIQHPLGGALGQRATGGLKGLRRRRPLVDRGRGGAVLYHARRGGWWRRWARADRAGGACASAAWATIGTNVLLTDYADYGSLRLRSQLTASDTALEGCLQWTHSI